MDNQSFDIVDNKEQNKENVTSSSTIMEEISIYDVFSQLEHKLILFSISIAVILLTFSDTAYLPAIHTIAVDLNTTDALVNLTISLYLLSIGISSLIWGIISDRWGRNLTMRIGLLSFLISSIICIFSSNIVMLSILRLFQGGSISVTMVVGPAVIADIYPADQRGWATGIFFFTNLLGVALGPIIGGILEYYLGWRSIFIFQSIVTFFVLLYYILIVPETHQYKVMMKTINKKIIEHNEILKPHLANPFLPLKYLIDLSIIPYILSASTSFASIIINQCILSILLAQPPYNCNELKIGILMIPLGIAELLGSILGGYWADKGDKYFQTKRSENRLIPGTICFLLIPIGLIIYGWAFQYKLNVSIPIICGSIVAFGQAVYSPAVYAYLTIKEQQNAATVSSANNFLNFVFAAIGLSISVPLINIMNDGPFFTITALINILAIILTIMFIFKKILPFGNNYQSI